MNIPSVQVWKRRSKALGLYEVEESPAQDTRKGQVGRRIRRFEDRNHGVKVRVIEEKTRLEPKNSAGSTDRIIAANILRIFFGAVEVVRGPLVREECHP